MREYRQTLHTAFVGKEFALENDFDARASEEFHGDSFLLRVDKSAAKPRCALECLARWGRERFSPCTSQLLLLERDSTLITPLRRPAGPSPLSIERPRNRTNHQPRPPRRPEAAGRLAVPGPCPLPPASGTRRRRAAEPSSTSTPAGSPSTRPPPPPSGGCRCDLAI